MCKGKIRHQWGSWTEMVFNHWFGDRGIQTRSCLDCNYTKTRRA